MAARFGVSFDGFVTTSEAFETAREFAAAGASSLWMAEHLGYREAIATSMGFRIYCPELEVVPTAVSPYLWHPTPTAMALATLAEVGSAPVGVAIGVGNPLFLAESGEKIVKPIRAVREFTDCLEALWRGEATTYSGEMFNLAGARLGFKPPQPLITYIAATGEQMLKLSGRMSNGVVLSAGLSPLSCRASLDLVRQEAEAAGRDWGSVRRAAYLFLAVSEDGAAARDLVRAKLAFLFLNDKLAANIEATGVAVDQAAIIEAISRRDMQGAAALVSDEAVAAYAVAGTPAECNARIDAFLDAGIDEPVLMVLGEREERRLALSMLAARTGAVAA